MKFSCGYSDDGIGHDCCKIVEQLENKIKSKQKEFDDGSYDVGFELEMLKEIRELELRKVR